MLLGSAHPKAARRTLMKFTPGHAIVIFSDIFSDNFFLLQTLDEAMKARSRHLEDLSVQCRPLTTDATVSGQALPLFQQLVGLRLHILTLNIQLN